MTDAQRLKTLRDARKHLRQTTKGYNKVGSEWRAADKLLDQLEADLKPKKPSTRVPNLGPILQGGKSLMLQDCTHLTDGLGWPALDDMGAPGRAVVAPEACVVDDDTSGAQGGDAFYIKGASGIRYWVGHITTVPRQGTKFRKGQKMTTISPEHRAPHCHLGIDARPLIGRHLISHTDYTHGAPLIGVQLTKALAT